MSWLKNVTGLFKIVEGLRKWTIMIMVIVTSSLFLYLDTITAELWASLLKYTVVSFFAINGVEHGTKLVKEISERKNARRRDEAASMGDGLDGKTSGSKGRE